MSSNLSSRPVPQRLQASPTKMAASATGALRLNSPGTMPDTWAEGARDSQQAGLNAVPRIFPAPMPPWAQVETQFAASVITLHREAHALPPRPPSASTEARRNRRITLGVFMASIEAYVRLGHLVYDGCHTRHSLRTRPFLNALFDHGRGVSSSLALICFSIWAAWPLNTYCSMASGAKRPRSAVN